MIEGKGLGGKRINRVNLSLDNKTDKKLNQLAVSCNQKKTTLCAMIVEMCLNDPVMVSKLQDEYNIHPAYKILPISINGETEYLLDRD